MINIKLSAPFLLFQQLDENLLNAIGLTEKEAKLLLIGGVKYVMTAEEGDYQKYQIIPGKKGEEEPENAICGSEAILWLCKESNYEVTPITEINIPAEVFKRCAVGTWLDICSSVAYCENSNDRLLKLCKLNAPRRVIDGEKAFLRKRLEVLESNNYNGKILDRHKDNTARYALNDIGFSLLSGWYTEE